MEQPDGSNIVDALNKYGRHSQEDGLMTDERKEIKFVDSIDTKIFKSVKLTIGNEVVSHYENIDGEMVDVTCAKDLDPKWVETWKKLIEKPTKTEGYKKIIKTEGVD